MDIVRKRGQSFELTAKYTGVPKPTIEWFKTDDVSLRMLQSILNPNNSQALELSLFLTSL